LTFSFSFAIIRGMDIADIQRQRKIVERLTEGEVEVPEDKKKRILQELITKGRYREEVHLPDLNIKVTFRTRTVEEESEVRRYVDRMELRTAFAFYFFIIQASLAFSLEAIGGVAVSVKEDLEGRMKEIGRKLAFPIYTRIQEEFLRFEREVLEAVNPNFLKRQLEQMRALEPSSKSESSEE